MGADKKISIDSVFELDELKAYIGSSDAMMNVKIELTEFEERKPSIELYGKMGLDEIVEFIENRKRTLHATSQRDELTGLFNKDYFEKRLNTIDRSQVLPVAIINFNINDWKFVNDNFGDAESDRLISIIANVLIGEAKPYFVMGRIDGDIFGVLIPMALDGEAEEFVRDVKDRCDGYEDPILAPSVAAGIVYKTNIEQKIEDLMSDAEYEMFDDKFKVKNKPGYKERLNRGIINEE